FFFPSLLVLLNHLSNEIFLTDVTKKKKKTGLVSTFSQLGAAYVSATTGAVVTALGLKSLATRLPPIVSRFVPFAAVAAANCINIPFMRQRELKYGIPVTDENGNRLGESVNAAQQAIMQVVVSRIGMAVPAMGKGCSCENQKYGDISLQTIVKVS
ncbi:sideroflexin-3-like, partial [Hippocampus comes]|uniref:sideroflexin-3-like n=1 Tax=Hippocampus comes TaxID=109280 RepID=UPI00094EA8E3